MTPLRSFVVFAFLVPLAAASTGCAGRAAPFNSLDKAPMTIMRLQGQEQPQAQQPGAMALPQIPGLPIPPEFQQNVQQALQGLQTMLPPGLIPPGLIPGAPNAQANANLPKFKNFPILAQSPVTDEDARDELLDIFGHESNFTAEKGQCFAPGMGITISRGSEPPVDLLISISCNQAMGDGFKWPYAANGFTPDARQRLTHVYEKLWGPVPPGA